MVAAETVVDIPPATPWSAARRSVGSGCDDDERVRRLGVVVISAVADVARARDEVSSLLAARARRGRGDGGERLLGAWIRGGSHPEAGSTRLPPELEGTLGGDARLGSEGLPGFWELHWVEPCAAGLERGLTALERSAAGRFEVLARPAASRD